MEPLRFNEDVYSISEFRINASNLINKAKDTRRPILITQNGKGAAVLLDVKAFDELMERTELIAGISKGLEDIQKNKVVEHSKVKKMMKKYSE